MTLILAKIAGPTALPKSRLVNQRAQVILIGKF